MSVKVVGHRGARGILPELSLPGFSKALDLNVDMIELDVGITRDEVVVAHHDRMLNSDITRDRAGCWIEDDSIRIVDLTYAELQEYDIGRIRPKSAYASDFPHQEPHDGCRVPKLEEVVNLVRSKDSRATLCIEAKYSPMDQRETHPREKFVEIVADEIIRLEIASASIIQSFDWQTAHAIRNLVPGLEAWHLTSQLQGYNTLHESLDGMWTDGMRLAEFAGSVPEMIAAAGGKVWNSDYQSLNAESINEAHRLGLEVYAWTVNIENDFQALSDSGIDGIITDYPDRLIRFLQRPA